MGWESAVEAVFSYAGKREEASAAKKKATAEATIAKAQAAIAEAQARSFQAQVFSFQGNTANPLGNFNPQPILILGVLAGGFLFFFRKRGRR